MTKSSSLPRRDNSFERLAARAFAPIDIASLVFFRIAFGALMLWTVWIYFSNHWVTEYWVRPHLFFKFAGFSWVEPWPGNGVYIHWAALGVLAFFGALGFLYRLNAVLLFLSYTYFFLLDETRYMNHAYLICLLSFLLIFIPANRAWSIDAIIRPNIRSQTVPAWSLWLLRTQIAIVYFFGGIAKITPDWLRGEPMRMRLARHTDFPILGRFYRDEWMVYAMSYCGLLLDLSIVPLLLWRRTRLIAFCAAVIFHVINAGLFNIDIFPWLAIAGTSLFLSPSWPRRILSLFGKTTIYSFESTAKLPSRRKQTLVIAFASLYLAIQILIPLRPFVLGSGSEWILMEHRFCWRMMLRDQFVQGYFYVTDPNVDRTTQMSPARFLTASQLESLYWQPDTIVQFAHYLAKKLPRAGPVPLKVEARLFVSINGRKPELFVNPNVDYAIEPRPLTKPRWLLPLNEPLPPPRQDMSEDLFGESPNESN